MKHSARRGFVTTYDPKAKEKENIRRYLKESFKSDIDTLKLNPHLFPTISFIFHMPIPSSIPKKSRNLYESGFLKHDKKPDVDNLIKLYLDCLDGIVIHGDQRVSLGTCIKLYHPEPKTMISIQDTPKQVGAEHLLLFSEEP